MRRRGAPAILCLDPRHHVRGRCCRRYAPRRSERRRAFGLQAYRAETYKMLPEIRRLRGADDDRTELL
jgi:hypothetical protein